MMQGLSSPRIAACRRGGGQNITPHVIITPDTGRVHKKNINDIWNAACKEAEVGHSPLNNSGNETKELKKGSGQRSGDEAICIPFTPHLYPLCLNLANCFVKIMAERVGFEPTVPVLAAHTISSRVPSASSDISPQRYRSCMSRCSSSPPVASLADWIKRGLQRRCAFIDGYRAQRRHGGEGGI